MYSKIISLDLVSLDFHSSQSRLVNYNFYDVFRRVQGATRFLHKRLKKIWIGNFKSDIYAYIIFTAQFLVHRPVETSVQPLTIAPKEDRR